MTDQIIEVDASRKPTTLHWGSCSNYRRFCGACFTKYRGPILEEKLIVETVEYQPDKIYNLTDGMAGRCWIVEVRKLEYVTASKYYIRNWVDIVNLFDQLGYKFVCNTI